MTSNVLLVDGRPFAVPSGVQVVSLVGDNTGAVNVSLPDGTPWVIKRVPLKNPAVARRCRRLVSLHRSIRPPEASPDPRSLPAASHGISPLHAYIAYTAASDIDGAPNNVDSSAHAHRRSPPPLSPNTPSPTFSTASLPAYPSAASSLTTSSQPPPYDVYLVAPCMESSLRDGIRSCNRPLNAQHVLVICREVATALEGLHANDVVVGNLCPATIGLKTALNTKGSVRITDLSAAHLGVGESMQTAIECASRANPDRVMWYDAPEIAWGGATTVAAPSSDIWSLGCILAEALSATPLFPASNAAEHARMVTDLLGYDPDISTYFTNANIIASMKSRFGRKRPTNLATRLPGVDTFLVFLVSRMLVIDASKRLTAAEIVRCLTPSASAAGGGLTMAGENTKSSMAAVASASAATAGSASSQQAAGSAAAPMTIPPTWAKGITDDFPSFLDLDVLPL